MDRSYGKLKTEVLKNIDMLESVATMREARSMFEYLEEIKQNLLNDRFNLVVLGEFKRGKTTFLNALLGTDILPTDVLPLTSIVTLIRFGKEIKIEVIFLNGDTKTITPGELPGYVTEAGNPGNKKKVKEVCLEHPSTYLKEGIMLIDTPGVGSIYQNNTDETYSYLPKVDAAIFLLSSDQPISQSEIGFLKDIAPYSVKIFFILNKIDYLSVTDRQKAVEFAKKVLIERVGFTEVNIFPLSAKLALEGKIEHSDKKLSESNLQSFTSTLDEFLLSEKGRATINAACHKGRNAAFELRLGVELEMKALDLPIEELKAKIELFDDMAKRLQQEQEDNSYIFKGEVNKVYHELEREISGFQEYCKETLNKEIDQIYHGQSLSGRKLMSYMESYIEDRIKVSLEEWQPEVEKKVRDVFNKVVSRFTNRTNLVIGELLKQSAEIFDLKLEGFAEIEALTDETSLYYIFGEQNTMFVPDSIKIYALFLPGFISGPMIMSEMRKKIEREIDRNCGRLRTDYNERIIKSVDGFRKQFKEKFDTVIEGTRFVLVRAVEKRESSQKETTKSYEKLSRQVAILEYAISGFNSLSSVYPR
ncbi:dynamin family protein [Pelotomaculum propionicicum]|uniref:Bacterial dynamin-like protein n=1 Tax=Pelotomaculum propionicicum TaxID=258475 RepID=A0A4Y7RWN3_9FIRM|nr:dynamin family protein [Pelotomaculum propionicicum]TEB13311.1 Bacterial dynamin-like protein [Pelotomaculum propionicicum]